MATTAAAAEADDAKKQVHDDAAVGSISHILRTLFRGLYEESEAPEDAEAEGPAPAEAPACITDEASVASLRMELQTEPWFDAKQIQVSWYLSHNSDRIVGVEPMVRVSIADPNKRSYNEGGMLFTPGFAAYFQGRSRVSANLDMYRSSRDGTFWALRVGTLLYF